MYDIVGISGRPHGIQNIGFIVLIALFSDIRANTLTRKLNSNADMLLAKYNILYSNKRVGTEKHIVLKLEQTS